MQLAYIHLSSICSNAFANGEYNVKTRYNQPKIHIPVLQPAMCTIELSCLTLHQYDPLRLLLPVGSSCVVFAITLPYLMSYPCFHIVCHNQLDVVHVSLCTVIHVAEHCKSMCGHFSVFVLLLTGYRGCWTTQCLTPSLSCCAISPTYLKLSKWRRDG